MKKATASLAESLVSSGLLQSDQVKKIEEEVARSGEPFYKVLKRQRLLSEQSWIAFLGGYFNISVVEIAHQIVKPEVLKLIPEELTRRFQVFPLVKLGQRLTVCVSDPFNLALVDQLRLRTGMEIDIALATESEIRNAIDHSYGTKTEFGDLIQNIKDDSDLAIEEQKKTPAKPSDDSPTIKLVNLMITQAIRDGASDIHIAPEKDRILVRFRIDGVLKQIDQYPRDTHSGIVSRIKVLSNLDISENRIPQDGRARFESPHGAADLRVSVMPTVNGENIVIRVLNIQNSFLSLEKLGMNNEMLSVFRQLISKPYGILLITGPTGSGKTSSLYAALSEINTADRNIVTIEDPVEYQLPLIRQIQVNSKVNLTFANGLRSILRQDPDVIMVGEIRDKETATIAIQAALTGHMVFSTLHTNNSASAITRLVDMGIEPFLVASTVVGIVAQRLVRTICKDCRESRSIKQELLKETGFMLPSNPSNELKLYHGKGCLTCKKSGYKGREGLFEVLVPDSQIKRLVMSRASSEEIETYMQTQGFKSLRADGLAKALSGVTSIEEILRVTQE